MGNAISRHRRPAGPAPAARLRACEDGAVAVEYAMIAPAFMALLLGSCASAGSALLFVSHDARLAGRFHRVVDLPAINQAATGAVSGAAA